MIFKNPRVVEKVKEVSNFSQGYQDDSGIDVFGSKFYPMWPEGGKSVSWHQDSHYFGTGPSQQIISVGIYIEQTDKENGCFRVVPRTHNEGKELDHTPGVGPWKEGEWIQLSKDQETKAIDLECPAGTVVLFDARLAHSAHENSSKDRTRFSFFGHYCPANLQFQWRDVDFAIEKYEDRHVVYRNNSQE